VTDTIQSKLIKACYAFLVPFAKTLLRAGVSYRELDDLIRRAYVIAASEEFGLRGRPTNNSRIAAMTGIPRKEVSRIRARQIDVGELPRTELGPLGDILQMWHTDSQFLDQKSTPLSLPVSGSDPSFEKLVRLAGGDLPVGAVKVELLRIGAISQSENGQLRPIRREAIPREVDDRLVTSLSFNLFCLASTIAHNSNPERKSDGRIERFVQSNKIPDSVKKNLRRMTRKRIEQFTEELDDVFSAVDSSDSTAKGRVGVGVFYYEDD